MLTRWLNKIIPSRNQRLLRAWRAQVGAVAALEEQMRERSNGEFLGSAARWREQIDNGAGLDDLLPEVYAATREVARRRVDMRHFDAQIYGGIALHKGKISEMATGEGKTLVATLPAVLNALGGSAHIVTVNEYLANRDCEWMGEIYRGLGLGVATIFSGMKPAVRREAYQADITYGTNSEFGFDYLRDNMRLGADDKVQRSLGYAIVDEVDSILIDEARTPLVISGVLEDDPGRYTRMDAVVAKLRRGADEADPGDFTIDEKSKRAHLSESGQEYAEELLHKDGLIEGGLYDPRNSVWLHHLDAALRARFLYHRDTDYVVRDGRVHIVDAFTGRLMEGRRWSSGLHQAIEAKERVAIQAESQTLASITLQNYFRMYDKLSGMTGTASTEAPEFMQIYGVEVVSIPTHKPNIRIDAADRVYLTLNEKYDAIVEEIRECHEARQPALVGTTSIETSELISTKLRGLRIEHMVLNAKQHEQESYIVANAGNLGAVTIATNMAGRGTDIVLGGNLNERLKEVGDDEAARQAIRDSWRSDHERVVELGGLHIIGSERHESRRIDNQLRGRCARQGDPGSTRFYLSLQDSLMRIFASDAVSRLMKRLGLGGGEAIEHPLLTRSIVNAQRKVEAHNFEMRKNLLDYDNVVNQQRRFVYEQRESLIESSDTAALLDATIEEVVSRMVESRLLSREVITPQHIEQLCEAFSKELSVPMAPESLVGEGGRASGVNEIGQALQEAAKARWQENRERLGEEMADGIVRQVALQGLDKRWREHLSHIDYIKQGIHLRSYAQRQPIQEFKKEAFGAFFDMVGGYRHDICAFLLRPLRLGPGAGQDDVLPKAPAAARQVQNRHDEPQSFQQPSEQWHQATGQGAGARAGGAGQPRGLAAGPPPRKMGRNEPCHCGSGKKYKHCHGR